jgi:hypothetical protein
LFKLSASCLAVMKSSLEVAAFSSACIKLIGEVSNSGVKMVNLI